jgi:hypothetical protein
MDRFKHQGNAPCSSGQDHCAEHTWSMATWSSRGRLAFISCKSAILHKHRACIIARTSTTCRHDSYLLCQGSCTLKLCCTIHDSANLKTSTSENYVVLILIIYCLGTPHIRDILLKGIKHMVLGCHLRHRKESKSHKIYTYIAADLTMPFL